MKKKSFSKYSKWKYLLIATIGTLVLNLLAHFGDAFAYFHSGTWTVQKERQPIVHLNGQLANFGIMLDLPDSDEKFGQYEQWHFDVTLQNKGNVPVVIDRIELRAQYTSVEKGLLRSDPISPQGDVVMRAMSPYEGTNSEVGWTDLSSLDLENEGPIGLLPGQSCPHRFDFFLPRSDERRLFRITAIAHGQKPDLIWKSSAWTFFGQPDSYRMRTTYRSY